MGGAGTITLFPFGTTIAATNAPFLLIQLQWVCTVNATMTYCSALECSNP
jgi:hypothetical protein